MTIKQPAHMDDTVIMKMLMLVLALSAANAHVRTHGACTRVNRLRSP